MLKNGNRFYTDIDNKSINSININISGQSLKHILKDIYLDIFNTEESFFIKNNIYQFNKVIKNKLLLFGIKKLLDENNISAYCDESLNNDILKVGTDKIYIINCVFHDSISLIDFNEIKNNKLILDSNYIIFANSNPINLVDFNRYKKIKNIDYICNLVLNSQVSFNISGYLEKEYLNTFLISENLIPSKTIIDNKKVLPNAAYFIYNNKMKNIENLLDYLTSYNHSGNKLETNEFNIRSDNINEMPQNALDTDIDTDIYINNTYSSKSILHLDKEYNSNNNINKSSLFRKMFSNPSK